MCKKLFVLVLAVSVTNVALADYCPGYQPFPIVGTLVAHYNFDEGSGTTLIDSVGGHNATILNQDGSATTYNGWVTGHDGTAGGAYNFNGAVFGYQAGGAAMPGGPQQTVAFWFKGNSSIIPGSRYPYSEAFYSNTGTLNYMDTSWCPYPPTTIATVVAGSGYSDQTYVALGSAINDGSWHHIAMVKDATAGYLKIYLDLELKSNVTGMTNTIPASTNLFIGSSVYGGTIWNGAIDDLQIYATPEPATMALLGLGALVLRRRIAR